MADSPSTATRLYLFADTLVRRALRALEAVHRGVWLGLLQGPALDQATLAMYARTRSYNQADYNRSGLSYWEDGLVARHFGSVRSVLVAAAGGGRELIAFAGRGLRVEGFDPEPGFVESGAQLLRELGVPAELRLCPPGQVPDGPAEFEGAIIGWNAYTHIPGRRARVAFLRALGARLLPDGILLLSFFPRSDQDRMHRLTWLVGRVVGALRRRDEPVQLGDCLMVGYYHFLSESDLRAELDAAQFELVEYADHPQGFAAARRRAR